MRVTLFDFNGVLVDDEHVHQEAFRDVLAPRGLTLTDRDYVERYLGFDDAGAFRAIVRDATGQAPSDAEVRALVAEKKPHYMARIETGLKVFSGAPELIRRRASLGIVGIVSGALEHEIRFCLEKMGVLDLIAFIVPAERCRECKPDPEGYLHALDELSARGISNAQPVVVEDSIAGVVAAKRANLRCVAVTHSYPEGELTRAGADAVVADLYALTDAVVDGASGG